MKKILFIIAITGLIFTSCGNKKKQNNSETHVHEDGTVHANDAHSHEQNAKPDQESFEVETDDNVVQKHPHGNIDAGDHKHEHGNIEGEGNRQDKDEPNEEEDHHHVHTEHN